MKTIVLATSLLALSAGFAAAEVTLSGDARMGVISDFGATDMAFTSRVRVKFNLSGATDGGLEFGASVRNDQSGVGNTNNNDSTVFISGAFGKLSMGDVDSAAAAAVGQVSGVGLTGLGDLNEIYYNSGGAYGTEDTSVLYEYTANNLSIYAGATQPTASDYAYGVAAKYTMGDYTVSLGYERYDTDFTDVFVGGTAAFGAVTVKAVYGHETSTGGFDGTQWAVSVDYKADALTVTAFYADDSEIGGIVDGQTEGYGVGASYDLGGGASVVGGYVKNVEFDTDAYDLGVSMSF